MAYNSTTGSLHVGDLLNEDDEDTQIDFGYDSIIFRTNRLPRFQITNNSVSASGPVSGSEFRAEVSLSSSRGVTGSSLQVGAYGLTNDGRIAINTLTLGGTAVTSTAAELNLIDGSGAGSIVNSKAVIYGSSGEVNATTLQIAGSSITSNTTELNLVDGSSAGTVVASKAVIYGSGSGVNAVALTASAGASINSLVLGAVAVTSTGTELNLVDGASAGITVASKAAIYSSSGSLNTRGLAVQDGTFNLTIASHDGSNGLVLGSTLVTSTGEELNLVDGSSAGTMVQNKAVIYSSAGAILAQSLTASAGSSLGFATTTQLTASRGLSGSSLLVGTATKYGLHWDGGLAISKINTNWTNAGRTIADLGIATTADIRGGVVNGTSVGATNQSTGQFTSLSSSTLETARGATLGKNTGDRTRITGSFSVSGSVMGHQFFPTRHAYATTNISMKFIPFYSLSEANAPNNASYINQMVVPFSGQLKRVYYRPSGSQNGNVSIALFKASDGNGDINMNEQGVLIETQIVSCANAASTTSVFNFTGSNHYSAGEVVGVSVHPNANQVEVNLVCLWEYNIYGL